MPEFILYYFTKNPSQFADSL